MLSWLEYSEHASRFGYLIGKVIYFEHYLALCSSVKPLPGSVHLYKFKFVFDVCV